MAAATAAAAMAKLARRSRESHRLLVLRPTGRRAPEGGVAPILPRLGATSLSSLAAPAARTPRQLMQGKGLLRGIHSSSKSSLLHELKTYHIWTDGSGQMYDSKYLLLFLMKRVDDLGHHIRWCRRNWTFPALVLSLSFWILGMFVYEYYRQLKNKKALAQVHSSIAEKESETVRLRSSLAEMEEELKKLV